MGKATRASYSCARCFKRKKKCDRSYPTCSQCAAARAKCIALDRGSDKEVPRSLVSYLEEILADLQSKQGQSGQHAAVLPSNNSHQAGSPEKHASIAGEEPKHENVINVLAAKAAATSTPVASLKHSSRQPLPYYRIFFMGAELPFPLAFQSQRPINIPTRHGGNASTQLPRDVAEKLMAAYVDRMMPQYPLFLQGEIDDMFENFSDDQRATSPDDQFCIYMVLAIATLSSKTSNYRKLLSVAEALRRDALSCLDLDLSLSRPALTTIRQLLLLVQYGFLLPSFVNLWHIVGEASRLALALGLHHDTLHICGFSGHERETRKRIYWVLYAIERSVAITAHRPFAISRDQLHLPFPRSEDFPSCQSPGTGVFADGPSMHTPYIRFIDRLQFLHLQTEVCSINIGLRAIPDHHLSHESWLLDVEGRLNSINCDPATIKWCSFLKWHTILLLHMPCARNPHPTENSVLKYLDAALNISKGYWELIGSGNLSHSWHATHHCYEAGNLILYSLWYYHDLTRRKYATAQVFEAVHQISGIFVLLEKKWPAAHQCGRLFDRLRNMALRFFGQEEPGNPDAILEARQLRGLVFRENADFLYAREQPASTANSVSDLTFPDFDLDGLDMDLFMDFPGFFNSPAPRLSDNNGIYPADPVEQDIYEPDCTASFKSPEQTSFHQPDRRAIDVTSLEKVMQSIPVCSPCRLRRVKCDMCLPACRNCVKHQRECNYRDSALGKDFNRQTIHDLYVSIQVLMEHNNYASQSSAATLLNNGGSNTLTSTDNARQTDTGMLFMSVYSSAGHETAVYFGHTSAFGRLTALLESFTKLPATEHPPLLECPSLFQVFAGSISLNINRPVDLLTAKTLISHYIRNIETLFPILGEEIIVKTINVTCNTSTAVGNDISARTRFNLLVSISLSLLSAGDARLRLIANTYFRDAMSCMQSHDCFVNPATESLQTMLLVCLYTWICPDAADIWRLLGHTSRLFLDFIEANGADSTYAESIGVIYRTLYTLETEISIGFGRPHQLPDAQDLPVLSPASSMSYPGDMSIIQYRLVRLQNRLHRDTLSKGNATVDWSTAASVSSASWMPGYVESVRSWIADWNACVDALLVNNIPLDFMQGVATQRILLQSYGEFKYCVSILLAKIATDRRGQFLVLPEEELDACKRLLRAADILHEICHQNCRPSAPPEVVQCLFASTWSFAHGIFNAASVIVRHRSNAAIPELEARDIVENSIRILSSLSQTADLETSGLVDCLQSLQHDAFGPQSPPVRAASRNE